MTALLKILHILPRVKWHNCQYVFMAWTLIWRICYHHWDQVGLTTLLLAHCHNHTDADGTVVPPPTRWGIKRWIETTYKSSRGFELGTFDAALIPIIWKAQAANWEALGLGYISDVVSIVHTFISKLLNCICKDSKIKRGLKSVLLEQLRTRYQRGIAQAKFVTLVEKEGTQLTTNHYFADNLEKRCVQCCMININ